jgi:hypothetical protein
MKEVDTDILVKKIKSFFDSTSSEEVTSDLRQMLCSYVECINDELTWNIGEMEKEISGKVTMVMELVNLLNRIESLVKQ